MANSSANETYVAQCFEGTLSSGEAILSHRAMATAAVLTESSVHVDHSHLSSNLISVPCSRKPGTHPLLHFIINARHIGFLVKMSGRPRM
jgi:hypothetical protein